VVIELGLIKSCGLLEQVGPFGGKYGGRLAGRGRTGGRNTELFEVSQGLPEGQMAEQLDKANQIATLAAAMAVEEIFIAIDIEGRLGFLV
jgi:hypothetical protein